MQIMYPAIFDQLLAFVEFSCKPPQYGQLETKHIANAKYNQVIYSKLYLLYKILWLISTSQFYLRGTLITSEVFHSHINFCMSGNSFSLKEILCIESFPCFFFSCLWFPFPEWFSRKFGLPCYAVVHLQSSFLGCHSPL